MNKEHSENKPLITSLGFHPQTLIQHIAPDNTISQRELINLWNRLHFTDCMVDIVVYHLKFQKHFIIKAYPDPYSSNVLTCRFPEESLEFIAEASFLYILLVNNPEVSLSIIKIRDLQQEQLSFYIPEKVYRLKRRITGRYLCEGIHASITRDGFRAEGRLTDFSSMSFAVIINPENIQSLEHFKTDCLTEINLYRNSQIIFSSICQYIRISDSVIVFSRPSKQQDYPVRKILRYPYARLKPLPVVRFFHPIIKKNIEMDVHELSVFNFSVNVSSDEDVFMAGMIIPELSIIFKSDLIIKCKTRISSRIATKKYISYEFRILDMDLNSYNRLDSIIMNSIIPNVHYSAKLNVERLFELLFDSGFIYHTKYQSIQNQRQSIKETFRILYEDNPDIITHATYQQNGRIYGHVSMVRAYGQSWMAHHLAAIPFNKKRTGLLMLKPMALHFNGFNQLPSVEIKYLMIYYRPDNSFPDHFFGGFSKQFHQPDACSIDVFAYLNYPVFQFMQPLPCGWSLSFCTNEDLFEVSQFYKKTSGGILFDALFSDKDDSDYLSKKYARYGLNRTYQKFSLKQNDKIKAVIIVNHSDPGLSLSDFLNGIKVIVNDPDGLLWDILSAAVSQLSREYTSESFPLLVYPSNYLEQEGISFDKKYNLLIINIKYASDFSEYMLKNTKVNLRNIIRYVVFKYLKSR